MLYAYVKNENFEHRFLYNKLIVDKEVIEKKSEKDSNDKLTEDINNKVVA